MGAHSHFAVGGWSDEAVLERMRTGWVNGETPCGGGSKKASAVNVIAALPLIVEAFGIHSICDAGAGDLNWIGDVAWPPVPPEYKPFDLVPRHPTVQALDITKTMLPMCDAILCRHVLIHFDPPRIEAAIELFRKSARFLIASQYDDAKPFNRGYQYNPTDLRPLLGEPLEQYPDYLESDLAVWAL